MPSSRSQRQESPLLTGTWGLDSSWTHFGGNGGGGGIPDFISDCFYLCFAEQKLFCQPQDLTAPEASKGFPAAAIHLFLLLVLSSPVGDPSPDLSGN